MNPLKTLIVDDDMIARKVMRHMLGKHESVSVIGEAGCPAEAIRIANTLRPDLLFLDIEMPVMNGFSLLSSLDYNPQVVFVTAHCGYAVDAFGVEAVDYLVKPVCSERLARTLLRLAHRQQPAKETEADTIYLRDGGEMHTICRGNITAITSDSNFTRIHRLGAQPLFIRKAISQWERMLPDDTFVRLDRSLIVNLQHIDKRKTLSRDKALLYVNGIDEPFVLRRVALLRFRKAEDAFIARSTDK